MSDSERDDDGEAQEPVRDLPDPERRKLTQEDIETLEKAGLGELAEIGKRYVPTGD